MRFLKSKGFNRWTRTEGISDSTLRIAAREIVAGQVEADLGGYLFKKRIAKDGGGKSGGYRVIVCLKRQSDGALYFMHGFDKGDTGNITRNQEKGLREIAKHYVNLTNEKIDLLIVSGLLFDIPEGQNE